MIKKRPPETQDEGRLRHSVVGRSLPPKRTGRTLKSLGRAAARSRSGAGEERES